MRIRTALVRVHTIAQRSVTTVLSVGCMFVIGDAVWEAAWAFAPGTESDMVDKAAAMRVLQASVVPLVAAVWALIAARPWWVVAMIAAPAVLVGLPTLISGRNITTVASLGFLIAVPLVLVGVAGNLVAPSRSPTVARRST